MENNLISNLLYRDNPYLNSFLLNGPNNPSVFHAFFLNYFQSSHISSENGIKTEQVMNLMEVNERLFDWLTFNRYLKRKDLSEHSFNKEDLCSEEFFDLFEFIKTPVVLHQAFTHPDGSSIDTLLCGKEI